MNVTTIKSDLSVSFSDLTWLNNLIDDLQSSRSADQSRYLKSNSAIGHNVDLIGSIYNPSLSYAEHLLQTLHYMLDVAYRRDPQDMIGCLLTRAAQKNPDSPVRFIPDIMRDYILRYEAEFGTEAMIGFAEPLVRSFTGFHGPFLPKLDAFLLPHIAEAKAKTQTPAKHFLRCARFARFGITPYMKDIIEERRDMDSQNRLRDYGRVRCVQLLPALAETLTDNDQRRLAISGFAQFYLDQDSQIDTAQRDQIVKLMDLTWQKYFENGGSALALYNDLNFERYDVFPDCGLNEKIEQLAENLAAESAAKIALELQWALAQSYPEASVKHRVILQSISHAITMAARDPANSGWLPQFCETAVRKLTRLTDVIPREAVAGLAGITSDALPPDHAEPIPRIFASVVRSMMKVMETHADSLAQSDIEKSATAYFLLARLYPRGSEDQYRLAASVVATYEKIAETLDREKLIETIFKNLRAVDSKHPLAVVLTNSFILPPMLELQQTIEKKLSRLARRKAVVRANPGTFIPN